VGELLNPEVFVGVFHHLDPTSLRIMYHEAVISREFFEGHDLGGAVFQQMVHGRAGIAGYPTYVVVTMTVVPPPVTLVFELERGRFDLNLIGSSANTQKGIVRVPFSGHVKHCAGEIVCNPVMPAKVGPHVVTRLIVVYTQVMNGVVKLTGVFHNSTSRLTVFYCEVTVAKFHINTVWGRNIVE
jgi:hypothetical protein